MKHRTIEHDIEGVVRGLCHWEDPDQIIMLTVTEEGAFIADFAWRAKFDLPPKGTVLLALSQLSEFCHCDEL